MKRHTWILIASAAITSISVAAPAVAAEPGFYFTAALGQAEEDPKSIGTNIWSFTSRWAIRAEYQRTGKLEKTSFLAGETELERMSLSLLFRL